MPLARPLPTAVAARPLPGPRALTGVLTGMDSLRVHLQPIVQLDTGEIWGVEALARFPGHPQPGPAAWFASALHEGRGPALEELALRGALTVLPELPEHTRLTVNLSAQALMLPTITHLLLEGADARVIVELTEHEQVQDYPALVAALRALREVGVGLAIDDFGAGHSSWRHVLRLAPEVLKLDLSLVQGVAESPQRQALVAAMVAFCGRTDTVLIAEGIEVPEDLRALMDLGVSHGQGWYLARPAEPAVVLPALTHTDVIVLPA